MARSVMNSLVQFGKVERGYLGVLIQDVTQDIAKVFGLDRPRGALVSDIVKDSPAEDAGLKRGDIIITMGEKEIDDSANLRNMVAQTPVGNTVEFTILRDGEEMEVEVKIGRQPSSEEEVEVVGEETSTLLSGVTVKELTAVDAQRFGIDPDTQGVIIIKVAPGSRAQESGLKAGDVIMEINRMSITDLNTYEKALKKVEGGKDCVPYYAQGSHIFYCGKVNYLSVVGHAV